MNADEIWALLPAVHRIRDQEGTGALRALVEVIADQVAVLDESLDQFYDDQFIEICADWVAPYIGDLVGYSTLHGVVPGVASPRAEVANTVRYRRRKGTAAMLEQLARDVTGWPARAVEFFERLATSQYMNHPRPARGGTPDLRRPLDLEWIRAEAGAFDECAHSAEVRRISTGAGRYNIPNVGLFLWRMAAVPIARAPLRPADDTARRFRFDPLGLDLPLYGRPRTEVDITHLAQPYDVPLPLSRRWLGAHLDAYYSKDLSLYVEVDGGTTPGTVHICDLSDDGNTWAHEPKTSDTVAIDPVLGRVCFAEAVPNGARALGWYHYGTAVPVGAGGFDRGDPTIAATVTVVEGGSLQSALDQVQGGGVVEVGDSWTYPQTPTITANDGELVTVRAANRQRPLVLADRPVKIAAGAGATVVLDGLLLAGGPVVLDEQADDQPRHLILRHCTLVPGLTRSQPVTPAAASLFVLHPFATVTLERCITGPVIAVEGAEVTARDCVLDASAATAIAYAGRAAPSGGGLRTVNVTSDYPTGDGLAPGAALTLDECTVVGRLHALRMDVSNSILLAEAPDNAWDAPVWARRRQVGCVRFSWLPPGSITGPRYECEPTGPGIRPQHTSLRYGDQAYAQLRPSTPDEIRRGADDEGAMGVTHFLFEPQREANLRIRLEEYLRFGLEAGPIYAS